MTRALCAVALCLASASIARAECRASAGEERSIALSLSPLAGVLCMTQVDLHHGGTCEGEPIFTAHLGCNETRQMQVTDDGHLVSLLARRASRRDWEIVRVFAQEGDRLVVRSVRLEELPGLPAAARRPRMAIDARRLTVRVEPELTIELARIVELGRVRARRRL